MIGDIDWELTVMADAADPLALARQYHATGHLFLAEQYCVAVLNDEPNHAEALRLLGLVTAAKGDPRQALVYLNRSLTANGANALTWQNVGDILHAGGDVRGCITYYEQALRLKPDHAEGHNTLGMAWKCLGEWAKATLCFQEATRLRALFYPSLQQPGHGIAGPRQDGRSRAGLRTSVKVVRHTIRILPTTSATPTGSRGNTTWRWLATARPCASSRAMPRTSRPVWRSPSKSKGSWTKPSPSFKKPCSSGPAMLLPFTT